ncbi:hypothetical protein VNO77_22703 [Canavalia gladiata]|uniref:Uncharacterized protein n=1 Tax=Canavalia gladiata TaxID=3824 RepID=A0AAN9L419_CANGL
MISALVGIYVIKWVMTAPDANPHNSLLCLNKPGRMSSLKWQHSQAVGSLHDYNRAPDSILAFCHFSQYPQFISIGPGHSSTLNLDVDHLVLWTNEQTLEGVTLRGWQFKAEHGCSCGFLLNKPTHFITISCTCEVISLIEGKGFVRQRRLTDHHDQNLHDQVEPCNCYNQKANKAIKTLSNKLILLSALLRAFVRHRGDPKGSQTMSMAIRYTSTTSRRFLVRILSSMGRYCICHMLEVRTLNMANMRDNSKNLQGLRVELKVDQKLRLPSLNVFSDH